MQLCLRIHMSVGACAIACMRMCVRLCVCGCLRVCASRRTHSRTYVGMRVNMCLRVRICVWASAVRRRVYVWALQDTIHSARDYFVIFPTRNPKDTMQTDRHTGRQTDVQTTFCLALQGFVAFCVGGVAVARCAWQPPDHSLRTVISCNLLSCVVHVLL